MTRDTASALFDTARVPDDPQYWDALAERVAAKAADGSKGRGLEWLARSLPNRVVASLLVAAALLSALLVLSSGGKSSVSIRTVEWVRALAPADDLGRAVASPNGPPALGALLLVGAGGA